jgi:hypothetical protein
MLLGDLYKNHSFVLKVHQNSKKSKRNSCD